MERRNETMICAPLMADTVDGLVELMHKSKAKGADIVEIRLDHLKVFNPQLDIRMLIKECPLPTLFTYRPIWEGGQYDGDEKSRFEALRMAMELGADHIDIELKAAHEFNDFLKGNKPETCKVIVSSHNYDFTPSTEELGNLVANIQAAGADIVKFATTAVDITDVARVFQITVHCQVPIIAMVMGERGLMSRVLCPKFGGYLTFGTLEPGKVSAPGQPTIDDLVNLYNFRLIDSDTKVFGIIGKPVSHSKSPKLFNTSFKSVGFNGVYVHLLVDDLAKFFKTYSSPDFAGFSCTIPHKESALACCDEVDPVAKSIGAVNCIVRRPNDGKLFGYNTDYFGAISAIEDGLKGLSNSSSGIRSPLANKLFIVIGAGGAGKALAYGAKVKGARVVIANRTYEKGFGVEFLKVQGDSMPVTYIGSFHAFSFFFSSSNFHSFHLIILLLSWLVLDRARELAELVGGEALSLADLSNFHPEKGMILANTTSIGMQPKVDETPVSKEALGYYELVFDAVYTPKITRLLREAQEMGAKVVTGVDMFIGQAYEQYKGFTGLPAPKELFKKIMEDH